ncbi:FKBP-type peptidyl-prolyl cis-trans isomerase [Alistipes sp. OttesenSCG-928-L06]|nr:FKBP-type peptidyl-prolyl cis-trans isomerase [Alistipes sp. OttesenSCG-928-L06]
MKIAPNTHVALTYQLMVDGELVDQATAERPLEFIYDAGFLLPAFEQNIKDLEAGQTFEFKLDAANGYGEVMPEAVIELPKTAFMVDGKIEDGMLEVGNSIPMMDNQGHQMVGVVKEVTPESVMMDFNHPLAGKELNFSGKVEEVREVTDVDRAKYMGMGGGCSCGCGDDHGDGNCDGCDGGCN